MYLRFNKEDDSILGNRSMQEAVMNNFFIVHEMNSDNHAYQWFLSMKQSFYHINHGEAQCM